jgi:peptide/nickel transport system ATP-binding protein
MSGSSSGTTSSAGTRSTITDVPVLSAAAVTKHFPVHGGRSHGKVVHAVESARLDLHAGEIVALVGESGSGKTTLARLLALLETPTGGEIQLNGKPVEVKSRKERRKYHSTVQMVLQDPFSSLNSTHRVRYILSRPLRTFGHANSKQETDKQVLELLERVNLTPAADYIDKFPYELSGGQRQRVSIARALAAKPKVLLGDEPVSMLDVSIRLDVLNLLATLRDTEGLALLYITHDIASARYFADRIAVMYAGQMVESGPSEELTQNPKHPYTRLLLAASPDPDREDNAGEARAAASDLGEPPSLIDPPSGCRFRTRCAHAMAACAEVLPEPTVFSEEGPHWARCHLY